MLTNDERELLKTPHLLGRWLGFKLLQSVHSRWISRWLAATDDLSHQAHRGSYKTTCLVVYIVLVLLFDPETTILYMRKEHTSAVAVVDQVRKVLEGERARDLFGKLHGTRGLRSSNWSKHSLTLSIKRNVTKEGNLDAGGIEVKTGAHYDLIIKDDGITRKDRRSAAERRITDDAIHELKNIRNPGGRILYVGTPWHEKDGWRLLPEPEKWPLGTVDLPEFSAGRREELKATLPASIYSCQYLLEHAPDEDRMFACPQFTAIRPSGLTWTFALDPGYKGDATTALVGAVRHEGLVHVVGKVWPNHVAHVYDEILDYLRGWKTDLLIVETNADKELSVDALLNLQEERGESHLYDIEGRHEIEDKHARISVRIKRRWPVLRFDPVRFEADAHDQLTEYREGQEPCDAPDALAAVLGELFDSEEDDGVEYSAGGYA